MAELERLLTQARAYGANANRTMDWNLEPLVPIVQKKQPFFVQAGSEQAIRDAIAWAERQGLNIVIRTSPAAAVATASPLRSASVSALWSSKTSRMDEGATSSTRRISSGTSIPL